MFRLWAKIWKENHLIKDIVIANDDNEFNRTRKIFAAIDSVCYEFDLSKPLWLDSTGREFQKHDKTLFYQDSFVDSIDFDYLERQLIEED